MAEKRKRPVLSVSIDPDNMVRLRRIVEVVPGATLSGIVDEMFSEMLPRFEALAVALNQARDDQGNFDEQRGRDALAQWAGAQMLELSDSWVRKTAEGEDG